MTVETIQEALCHVAGFPERRIKEMQETDRKAVELLTSELWEYKISESRLTVYTQLFAIYDEQEVPEYVQRLAYIMSCRYAPVPGSKMIEQAKTEAAAKVLETFGEKVR